MADFAAHALVLAQAAQEADLGGEDAVVGDLEQQLLTWDQRRRGVRTSGRRSPHRFFLDLARAMTSDGKNAPTFSEVAVVGG